MRSLRDIWPKSLQRLRFAVHLEPHEFLYRAFRTELRATPGIFVGKTYVRGTLRPSQRHGAYHGHFWLTDDTSSPHPGYAVELDIVPGPTRRLNPPAPDIIEFAHKLTAHIRHDPFHLRIILNAYFRYSGNTASPTVPLPITFPALSESTYQPSLISGFEFRFPDPSQPVRKAYVALGDDDNTLLVALTLSTVLGDPDELYIASCMAAVKHAGLFARPRQENLL
jgi:hypothetical protein